MSTKSILKLLSACCASAMFSATVAHATVVDLTASNTGALNGATFTITGIQPTGTGVFDPFLTVQNNGTEQGYNTSFNNFDTKREPQWNHEIQISDLRVQTIGNQQYYSFVIDVNEPNGGTKSLISLDMLKIWTSSSLLTSGNLGSDGALSSNTSILRYDLGSGNYVKYDDQRSGSGQGDIAFLVPVSVFASASS